MKQVLQEIGSGKTTVVETPAPSLPSGGVCIATTRSLISAGTEKMLVDFARASWINKARQQPEKVAQVLNKVKTDGLLTTYNAVRGQIEKELPLGYCNVGVVVEVGKEANGFSVGDRVVSNGPHAEVVAVNRNLCAKIPAAVSDDAAAFTVLAAIGLQGVRLTEPTFGESFAVIGLGLIGLITVQLLRANGCRVLAIDPDSEKTRLAAQFGATTVDVANGEDPVSAAATFTQGRGIDGVLITAATKSSQPVSQAAQMSRQRGRIVLVGVTGLELKRSEFYEKELSFQVSCSYGPGRYDPAYEEAGNDYPFGFVRWTEQRNFEAILDMLAAGALNFESLITHRFPIEQAAQAYDVLTSGDEAKLGMLLEYNTTAAQVSVRKVTLTADRDSASSNTGQPVVGMIGSGNYASRILLPALSKGGAKLHSIASRGGQSATSLGRKFSFNNATTDTAELMSDASINTIVIATRHDSHAPLASQALAAGKHVFVEKPLALTIDELDSVEQAYLATPEQSRPLLMIGFNRRFAPFVKRMKTLLETMRAPKTFIFTVNAGALPATHWTHDPKSGGGRIVGEGCHFIDLMRHLAGCAITNWYVATIDNDSGVSDDIASITLEFQDGSMGVVHYFANGHSAFAKERIEVFCDGKILQLNNFRNLRGYGWSDFKKASSWKQDKGQDACAAAFLDAVRTGGPSPIPVDEILEVSRISIEVGLAARKAGDHD